MWKNSIAFRYSIFFLSGILLIFTIAFLYTYGFTRSLMMNEAAKDAEVVTDLTIARLDNILTPAEQVPATLVHSVEMTFPDYKTFYRITENFILDNPVVFGSCIAFEPYAYNKSTQNYAPYMYETPAGIKTKDLGVGNYDYFSQPWYKLPKLSGRPVWTEPYFDKGGGDTMMCTYSIPFYREINGVKTFTGVVTMDISLAAFERIVSSVHVYESGFAFLVSHEGKFITSPIPDLVNKDVRSINEGKDLSKMVTINRMLKGQSGLIKLANFRGKQDNWLYYAPMKSTGWVVGVVFQQRELFAALTDFVKRLLAIFVASVLAILLTILLIMRTLTRPITRLVSATEEIGHGNFQVVLPEMRSKNEIAQLSKAFSAMQKELTEYVNNLRDTTIAKEKMESELKVANIIQMGLLPKEFPDVPEISLFACLKPARDVGGDMYDFFFLDDDHLFICVGDVSGKSVPASLFMTTTRILGRTRIRLDVPVRVSMMEINHELCSENPNAMFVTVWAGILNIRTGEMEACSAGHNPAMIIQADGSIARVDLPVNLPLGVSDRLEYHSLKFNLEKGQKLLLYTDGVPDATNCAGEMFGEEKFMRFLSAGSKKSLEELGNNLLQEIRLFSAGVEQADDITLLVLHFKGQAGKEPRISHHTLSNRPVELARIPGIVREIGNQWSLPEKMINEINLVLEELVSNIIFYAFDDDLEHHVVIESRKLTAEELQICVKDDGKPFNLLESTPYESSQGMEERRIGGLGITMIRNFTDSLTYQRVNNTNIVTLIKNIIITNT